MTTEFRLMSLFTTLFPEEELSFENPIIFTKLETWDSIKYVMVVLAVEEEFDIKFTNDEILKFDSFHSVLNILHAKGFQVQNPYVIGKLCYLRIPEMSDIDSKWYEWFSDPIITRFLTDRFWPNTKIEQIDFIRDLIGNRERLVLLICDSRSDSLLGICGLSNINWSHRYADWSIVLPQQTDIDPRVTMEASIMLLDSAFNRLNLLNIKSATMSLNLKSLSLQKLLGFKQVGYISNFFKIEGQLHDLVYLHLTSEDFKARNSI